MSRKKNQRLIAIQHHIALLDRAGFVRIVIKSSRQVCKLLIAVQLFHRHGQRSCCTNAFAVALSASAISYD